MSKIAFLFSGQGAQYVGMGKELYENFDVCKKVFDLADKTLGFDISKICFEGPEEELNKTENTQPAILTTSIAILKVLEEKLNIKADVTAGLSLGEYSALVYSGALEFEEAVALVKKRGKFMQEAVPLGVGTMAAVLGLDDKSVVEACREASVATGKIVEAANFNCPGQIVIGGEVLGVQKASEILKEKGARRVIELQVSGPFHTSLLKTAGDKLCEELKKVSINKTNIPLVSNVTGEYIKQDDDVKALLEKQVQTSVYWEKGIRQMINDGIDTFIEIGPGKVLNGFVKKIDKMVKILNIEDLNSLNKTLETLGGYNNA